MGLFFKVDRILALTFVDNITIYIEYHIVHYISFKLTIKSLLGSCSKKKLVQVMFGQESSLVFADDAAVQTMESLSM